MVLETIHIARHGFRSTFTVDPSTGKYSSAIPHATGIPTDPPLTGHGEEQSNELAQHLAELDPPIDLIFSSPFYRCVQTIAPTYRTLRQQGRLKGNQAGIRTEHGIGEWYGTAPFEHPSPATMEVMAKLFPGDTSSPDGGSSILALDYESVLTPPNTGESISELHTRVARTLTRLISRLDTSEESKDVKTIIICTHAATMIAAGRVLTGMKPGHWEDHDFHTSTCGVSTFNRRGGIPPSNDESSWEGTGILGGWTCEKNADTSFLSGGAERGWHFGDP